MVQAYLAYDVKGAEPFYFNSHFILCYILFYVTIALHRTSLIITFFTEPFIRREPIWFLDGSAGTAAAIHRYEHAHPSSSALSRSSLSYW